MSQGTDVKGEEKEEMQAYLSKGKRWKKSGEWKLLWMRRIHRTRSSPSASSRTLITSADEPSAGMPTTLPACTPGSHTVSQHCTRLRGSPQGRSQASGCPAPRSPRCAA